MCCGAAYESGKFPPVPVYHCQRNSKFWWNLFSALGHILCAYYVCIKTAHKLGYLYIYWRVVLCGSVLVGMVFVWANFKVEVCLVVFLVHLVAQ
jgi:hypothetical protein